MASFDFSALTIKSRRRWGGMRDVEILLDALYKIRRIAVRTGDPGDMLRAITVAAVDACDAYEGRTTTLDEKPEED